MKHNKYYKLNYIAFGITLGMSIMSDKPLIIAMLMLTGLVNLYCAIKL
jgi:hypothetical protein